MSAPTRIAEQHRPTTSLPTGYRVVDLDEHDRDEVLVLDSWAFPGPLTDAQARDLALPISWHRARGIRFEGELVAFHASYPFTEFPVPGARTAVAGLTWVGVHPGHRRRGLLRAMIADHFRRSLERHEAASALFAAEPAIYGRFGYGKAADDVRLTVARGAELRDVPGWRDLRVRIERLDPAVHGPVLAAVHGRVGRPGWATRQTAELRAAFLDDPEPMRDGAESMRVAVVERTGEPVGYALFRRKPSWQVAGPRGTAYLREVVAPEADVARALWGVLLDLDHMAEVETWLLAPDDPITHLLVDLRAARPRLSDNLWVRVLDVPAALSARRYAAEVDVVLEIDDPQLPANTGLWRLVGGPDGASVTASRDVPDLSLDVRELGAVYLGGVGLGSLARAGLVGEHSTGSADRVGTAFGWAQAPVCSWVF